MLSDMIKNGSVLKLPGSHWSEVAVFLQWSSGRQCKDCSYGASSAAGVLTPFGCQIQLHQLEGPVPGPHCRQSIVAESWESAVVQGGGCQFYGRPESRYINDFVLPKGSVGK